MDVYVKMFFTHLRFLFREKHHNTLIFLQKAMVFCFPIFSFGAEKFAIIILYLYYENH